LQPMFNIQYSEFKAAEYLTKRIKNSSAFIPLSPQQKGIDFIICKYNNEKNITCSFQVKMSRAYDDTKYTHSLWFNTFKVHENADWFILVGIYPENISKENTSKISIKWKEIMLAFKNKEMELFLDGVRQKKNPQKKDSKFGFGFDDNKKILLTRGSVNEIDCSKYLINNRISEIDKHFI